MAWATEMAERVNALTDLDVALYGLVYSPGVGTAVWTTFVPDLTALEAAGDKLLLDEDYNQAAARGAALTTGTLDDQLMQIVHGEPDPTRDVQYVTAVRAVCSAGNIAAGVGVGVEIAQAAERVTGAPTMFVIDTTGTYGGVGWITGHESAQAMEQAEQALMADPTWLAMIDEKAGGVYLSDPSTTTQLIYRRMG